MNESTDSATLLKEAMQHFEDNRKEAIARQAVEPDVMYLATASKRSVPSVRAISLAHADEEGFVFMINANSGKGIQLQENPQASVCFHWQAIGLQVLCDGVVVHLSEDEADQLWHKRSHDMKLSAWVTQQSQPAHDRRDMARDVRRLRETFDYSPVPRPKNWIAYRLQPQRIEFWQTGWRSLKERVSYQHTNHGWEKILLDP